MARSRTRLDAVDTADDRVPHVSRAASVSYDDIARRAHALHMARGGAHGHDVDDWLAAERDLRNDLRRGQT